MLPTILVTLGVCTDVSKDCYYWSLTGQCDANKDFMHKNCPLSCQVCEHSNCIELDYDCARRAKEGQCNDSDVLRECPITCGLCTPPCEDTHGDFADGGDERRARAILGRYDMEDGETVCHLWKRRGHCASEHKGYVLKSCPMTCGVCQPTCKDVHANCTTWAGQGACNDKEDGTVPEFMLKQCPSACGICKNEKNLAAAERVVSPGGCLDAKDECPAWALNGECQRSPRFMYHNCPASCHVCTSVCADHDDRCEFWAHKLHDGHECEERPAFMAHNCPASCGICSSLARHMSARTAHNEFLATRSMAWRNKDEL